MSQLKFISITRKNPHTATSDIASLSINGRANTPGFMAVVGGLQHQTEIAPTTERDRLLWIEFLESEECKALVNK